MSKKNFEIAFQLGAKMDPSVKRSFYSAKKQLNSYGKNLANAAKKGAKVVAGMGATMVGIGTAAFAMTNKVVGGFDTIAKNSAKLGVSTDAYQEMEYWASQNGMSTENMEKAVGRLNQRIGMASQGNEKYSNILKTLGVDMEGVKKGTVSTEDAMAKSIQALSQMTNEQEKAAYASELFGTKLGRELMPALQDGSLSLEDAKKKAKELGIVIDEDTLRAAEEFADTWDDLKRSATAFSQNIISGLMPTFQNMMDWVLENMPLIKDKISFSLSEAGRIAEVAFEKVQPILEWIGSEGIPFAMTAIGKMINIGGEIFEGAKKVYGFISDNWSTIKPIITGIVIGIVALKTAMVGMAIFKTVSGFLTLFKGATIASKLAMLGLNGAMLANPMTWVVAGVIALIAVGALLIKNWDAVKVFFVGAWQNIIDAVAPVGESIAGAFQFAYNAVTGLFSGIGEWFGGIWEGVTSIFKGAVNGMIKVANIAIGGLNKISIDIPDWVPKVGGKSFGVNIPNIPMLAKGGIVTGPTLAMVGEGNESEAVLPLSKLKEFIGQGNSNSTTNNKESTQIVYSPKFYIPDGATKKEIQEITRMSYEEFKKWIKKYERDKKRVAF